MPIIYENSPSTYPFYLRRIWLHYFDLITINFAYSLEVGMDLAELGKEYQEVNIEKKIRD